MHEPSDELARSDVRPENARSTQGGVDRPRIGGLLRTHARPALGDTHDEGVPGQRHKRVRPQPQLRAGRGLGAIGQSSFAVYRWPAQSSTMGSHPQLNGCHHCVSRASTLDSTLSTMGSHPQLSGCH
ncbi:MAG TPA: hypothetical protein DEF51_31285, partial [Myxococcales bacterium]|nr:hypothetical protein [Myxococcales bacterium]